MKLLTYDYKIRHFFWKLKRLEADFRESSLSAARYISIFSPKIRVRPFMRRKAFENHMKEKNTKFSDKYGPDAKPDPEIAKRIEKRGKNREISCAVAFDIAGELEVSPAEVGKAADLMEYRLVKCQLGLFGYWPEKAIVNPAQPEDKNIIDGIKNGLVDHRLPCETAWEIADRFRVRKMTVSAACEALGIKIKPCQLGAF